MEQYPGAAADADPAGNARAGKGGHQQAIVVPIAGMKRRARRQWYDSFAAPSRADQGRMPHLGLPSVRRAIPRRSCRAGAGATLMRHPWLVVQCVYATAGRRSSVRAPSAPTEDGSCVVDVMWHGPRVSSLWPCLVITGGDPRGGRIRAAAASSSATVQVEYKGTWTATFSQTDDPNDGRGKREQKSVTTVNWDFVWTGTLDQLLFPFKYPLSRKAGSNYFTPRLLTGTTSVTYSGYGEPPGCTGTLSYNPAGFPPPLFSFVTADPDPNKILLTVSLPSGQRHPALV